MYPAHIRGAMTDVTEFGRKPVGTGPYKLVEYSDAQGRFIVTKNPDYKWGGIAKAGDQRRAYCRALDSGCRGAGVGPHGWPGRSVPWFCRPTRPRRSHRIPVPALDTNPNIGLTYMWFDAAGQHGATSALTDPKVREGAGVHRWTVLNSKRSGTAI